MGVITRRMALGGTAGIMLAGASAAPASAAIITRNYLHTPSWEMRQITNPASPQFNGYGMHIHNAYSTAFRFEQAFWDRCSLFAQHLDSLILQVGHPRVDWFGAKYTYRPYGNNNDHPTSVAMDMSAIYFTGGDFVDMHISWRSAAGLRHQRKYTAIAAVLRTLMPEVLTHAHTGHIDHIHFDIDYPNSGPGLVRGSQKDTLIMQLSCNHFNGAGLALDGQWGSRTEAANVALRSRMGLSNVDPTRSYLEMANFLQSVGRLGLRNVAAGS